MLLICLYLISGILGYIFSVSSASIGILNVKITIFQRLLGIINLIAGIFIVVGILKRFKWGWYLILTYTVFGIIISGIQFFRPPTGIVSTRWFSASGVIISIIIAVYVYRKKPYFDPSRATRPLFLKSVKILAFSILAFFFLSVLAGLLISLGTSRNGRYFKAPTKIGQIYKNDATGITLQVKPIEQGHKNRHLWISRDSEKPYKIPAPENEDWRDIVVASDINKAFICILKSRNGGWDTDRLVELILPMQEEPLEEAKLKTILTMSDLDTDGGRSWISKLMEVSADGRYLKVKRAYPTKTGDLSWRYDHKIVIYDINKSEFQAPISVPDKNENSSSNIQSTTTPIRPWKIYILMIISVVFVLLFIIFIKNLTTFINRAKR